MGIFSSNKSQSTADLAASQGQSEPTPSRITPVRLTKGSNGITRESLEIDAPVLLKKFDKAKHSLSKRGLEDVLGDCYVALDNSVSMKSELTRPDKPIQILAERAGAWSMNVDLDGRLAVIPWDSVVHKELDFDAQEISGMVDNHIFPHIRMGGTNLLGLLKHAEKLVLKSDHPIFFFIVTDGQPDHGTGDQIISQVIKMSNYPIWLKFLAIKDVPFLQKLDDLEDTHPGQRLVDNVDFKAVGDPANMSDLDFAEAMTDELDTWIKAAMQKGLIA